MSVRDDLIAAKALIDSPEKWTKKRYRSGQSGTTRRYSPMGALFEICGTGTVRLDEAREALNKVLPAGWRTRTVGLFEDDDATTHADIMALFDRAIAAQPVQS